MELPRDPFAWGFTNITFKNLSFEVPDKDDSGNPKTKTIVEPCSGHLSTGSLTALMGDKSSWCIDVNAVTWWCRRAFWIWQDHLDGHDSWCVTCSVQTACNEPVACRRQEDCPVFWGGVLQRQAEGRVLQADDRLRAPRRPDAPALDCKHLDALHCTAMCV